MLRRCRSASMPARPTPHRRRAMHCFKVSEQPTVVEPAQILPRWLSVKGAALYSSLSEKSIRNLISAGKLPARRAVRGRLLIDRFALDALFTAETGRRLREGRGIRKGAAS